MPPPRRHAVVSLFKSSTAGVDRRRSRSFLHGRVTPHGKSSTHRLRLMKKVTANELPSKTKDNYASLIHTPTCQRHLDWRRLCRPHSPHRRCGAIVPLTVEPFRRRLHQTARAALNTVLKALFTTEVISTVGSSGGIQPSNVTPERYDGTSAGETGQTTQHARGGFRGADIVEPDQLTIKGGFTAG
jgi:hypothetical protein